MPVEGHRSTSTGAHHLTTTSPPELGWRRASSIRMSPPRSGRRHRAQIWAGAGDFRRPDSGVIADTVVVSGRGEEEEQRRLGKMVEKKSQEIYHKPVFNRIGGELGDKINRMLATTITAEKKAEIDELLDSLENLAAKDEILWKQRSKALWLVAGDRNTSSFHARADKRRVRKEIKKLIDNNGAEVSDREGIQRIILDYFRTMFESTRPPDDALENVLGCLEERVTTAMNESLLQPFTSKEALMFCVYVLEFMKNGSFDPLVNFTQIVLIAKCPNPSDMSQFRPISLCNVLYKLMSKSIANRIKPFLDSLISPSQAAFILGHFITDNVLVAYELNHFLKHKKKGKKGYESLKLDVSKAYDRMEWRFLEKTLSGMLRRVESTGSILRMIAGGPSGGDSHQAQKSQVREAHQISIKEVLDVETIEDAPLIQFGRAERSGPQTMHNDALVITAILANYEVGRIFIDSGSSVDILFGEAYDQMQLGDVSLEKVNTSLYGFAGEVVHPRGMVSLPLTMGEGPLARPVC
ncbi:UNVERIFIED_CONTAM: hypothetical protein Slati_2712500 [Sesamum latifolium]|uniref:Reverse transcriptase domain-containing protein n=1 Tax=Sesamum latifolium TaxID=2727402 RepID=A0AAW2VW24_9LAMI